MYNSHISTYSENMWANFANLSNDSIEFLWELIYEAEQDNISYKSNLAGNITRSLVLNIEKMMNRKIIQEIIRDKCSFYIDKFPNHSFEDTDIDNMTMTGLWSNYQKKYEFNPVHKHGGDISFVIWMRIPYDHDVEKENTIVKESNYTSTVGNFCFITGDNDNIVTYPVVMNSNIEGRIAIFPSNFYHMVYPFYTSDEYRISISGNVHFNKKNL